MESLTKTETESEETETLPVALAAVAVQRFRTSKDTQRAVALAALALFLHNGAAQNAPVLVAQCALAIYLNSNPEIPKTHPEGNQVIPPLYYTNWNNKILSMRQWPVRKSI